MKWGFKDHSSWMDTRCWDHCGSYPSLAGAALLPAGDTAPALTSPRGTAALGPRGASSILSPAHGKVKVDQGFCRGLVGPSAFYRLLKQLTSINQSGAGSMGRGAGKAGGACWEAGERRAWRGRGAAGASGTAGASRARQDAEDKGVASAHHLPPSHKHHPSTQQNPRGQLQFIYLPPSQHGALPRHCPAPLQSQIQASAGQGGTRPPSSPGSILLGVTQTESPASAQHRRGPVPSGEARRWAEAFRFQNDCVEGGRIETSPKNEAALALGKTDGHTDPLRGPDHLFCSVSAMLPAAAEGRNTLYPRGWAAPRHSWALIREMMLVCCWRVCWRQPDVADGWPEPIPVALGLHGLQIWFAPDNPAVILVKRREIQGS